MIRNRQSVLSQVSSIITTGRIAQANQFQAGPTLHFYQRALDLRRQNPSVSSFLASDASIEIIYATLVSWDMNSRGAELKDYVDFRNALQGNTAAFQAVEAAAGAFTWTNRGAVVRSISTLYSSLALMKTNGRLVSNAKCIHYVFPALCLPMDRTNTLQKLYGNTQESAAKFLEVLEFCYDVLGGIQNPQQYARGSWNTCPTKLVDNAIILM
jgi:hypothetical protein